MGERTDFDMKIAMLYICTGKYEIFWDEFYSSCEKYFYPEDSKEYFVFTDSERVIRLNSDRIHSFYQAKSGWPYDTLLRYNWFCTVQDKLKEFDFCYFVNANSVFLKTVKANVIPYPTEETPLVLSIHPRFYDDCLGETFNPERDPRSTAYVAEGTPCRSHCGAFWGGTAPAIMEMCRVLRDRTQTDLGNGIIAIWHDQSHLIKYATEVKHYNIAQGLVSYEEYMDPDKCVLMFPAKAKYGGNDFLREVDWKTKLSHLPQKAYGKTLRALKAVHMDGALRKAVHIFKK